MWVVGGSAGVGVGVGVGVGAGVGVGVGVGVISLFPQELVGRGDTGRGWVPQTQAAIAKTVIVKEDHG